MSFTKFKQVNLFIITLTLVAIFFPSFVTSAQIAVVNEGNVSASNVDPNQTNNQANTTNDKYVDMLGNLFSDANGDGIRNNDEKGLSDISIKITTANGEIIDILTDMDGNYSFRTITGSTQVTIDGNDPDLPLEYVLTTRSLDQNINFSNSEQLEPVGFSATMVNLALIKTVDKTSAKIQESLIYSLKFSNKGSRTANEVEIADQLPNSLEFTSATYENQSIIPTIEINPTGQKLIFNIPSLPPNQDKEILVLVKIKETTATKITNQASIISREADPIIIDNQSSVDVDITRTLVGSILNTVRTGGQDSNPSDESLMIKKSLTLTLIILFSVPLVFFVTKKIRKNSIKS